MVRMEAWRRLSTKKDLCYFFLGVYMIYYYHHYYIILCLLFVYYFAVTIYYGE